MTVIAHNATILGIPADPAHLFTADDRDYVVWLQALTNVVADTRRKEAKA